MFTEAQNLAIVRTELDTVFFQNFAYDGATPEISTAQDGNLFRVIPTEHAQYIGEVNMGTGLWNQITEVQTVPSSTPAVRNKYTISIADFADSIEISKDLFDDNMHGVWAEDVRQFALMARVTQDNNAFSLFRNAFTTTLTADGVSFINAAHPLISGGTVNNLITGALSDSTVNNAIVALREQKNQRDVILGGVPSILLVPSKLFKSATQITESALVSDSANNALNVYRSAYGFIVKSSPYLGAAAGGSDTAWFMLTRNHAVSRVVRQGVETALRPWQYSNNRSYLYQGNLREQVFVPDYSGAVGSTGL